MPVRAPQILSRSGRSCHRSALKCNDRLIHLRSGSGPHYIWRWRLSLLQHAKRHCQSNGISGLISKAPSAILKRGILPLESSAMIIKAAILELAIDKNVFLDNKSGTDYCVVLVNCNWHECFSPAIWVYLLLLCSPQFLRHLAGEFEENSFPYAG